MCFRHPLTLGHSGGWQRQEYHNRACTKLRVGLLTPTRPSVGERDPRIARLEAVLLLAREPLGPRKLGRLASLADGTEARTLVRRLNETYDHVGSAFRVEEVAGGFQLLTRAKFASWLRRLYPSQTETRLSGPALETLAVVAYRQPVVRAEIEAVRGVQCSEMLRQLMERELVRIVGRSEELGRPYLYGTTRGFLEVFGLRDLDELPRAEILRVRSSSAVAGLPAAPAAARFISHPSGTEEEFEVKKLADPELMLADPTDSGAVFGADLLESLRPPNGLRAEDDDDFEDDEEDLDDDEDDDDLDDDDEDDLDDEEEEEEDDWEEVDDEDDEDDLEEEDDEEEDEEEDDDWDDDDDEEWDDDDDEEEDWEEEE